MDNVYLNRMDHYLAYLAGNAKDYPDPTNQYEERIYAICKRGISGGGGASNAEAVSYINDAINSGNVQEALDKIIDKLYYVKPVITSFTTSPVAGSYELGSSIDSITFNWTYNKDIVSQSLTNCTIALNDRTTTYNTSITSNKSFTLTASDGENSVSNTKSFIFTNKVWYGSNVEGTYDDDFILGLSTGKLQTSKSGTYTVNVGNNEYFFIAMPTSYNNSDEISGKIGGFETAFKKVVTIKHTNASGYITDYNIYKSGNHSLGSVNFII